MSDFTDLDFYQLLDVSRSATQDEIKRAYRREITKYHPDRFVKAPADQQQYAQERSQRLTEAYATLNNFRSRSIYNASLTSGVQASTRKPGDTPPQARDHQAELYDQAVEQLRAGHALQAIGALRQLQQINPFYRDSAELLAQAEAQVRASQQPQKEKGERNSRRAFIVAGSVGGLLLAGVAAWALTQRGNSPTPTTVAGNAPTGEATAMPEPTGSLATAVTIATAVPMPTQAPTLAPTLAPTVEPTAELTAEPTVEPTIAATAVPPTVPAENGQIVFSDDFSSAGWADTSGRGWSVGYSRDSYRIAVSQNIGTIWSYRSARLTNYSVGADVRVTRGEGGLLLAFASETSFITFSVNPAQTSYRLDQRNGAGVETLSGGQSEAIKTGAQTSNRLVAQVENNTITLFINGQQIASVDVSNPPPSTRFGLVATSGATDAEAFFDNLEVRSLP